MTKIIMKHMLNIVESLKVELKEGRKKLKMQIILLKLVYIHIEVQITSK